MKTNFQNVSLLSLILIVSSGCLSSNPFKYKSRENLVLGKTLQSDIFQIVGKPNETQVQKIGSKTYTKLSYLHIKQAGGGFNPPMRVLSLEVVDGVLNGFNGMSSYKDEEIDVSRLNYDKIIEHRTKIDEIVGEFGFPTGQVIAPSTYGFVENVPAGNLVYTWQKMRAGAVKEAIILTVDPSTRIINSKRLIIN